MSKRNRISKLQQAYLDRLLFTVGYNKLSIVRERMSRNKRRMLKSLERQGLIRVGRMPDFDGKPTEFVTNVTLLEP